MDFMNNIKDNVDWTKADIVFASHHGRSSGRIPNEILEKICHFMPSFADYT